MEFLQHLMGAVTLDHVIAIAGMSVPAMSALASWVNHQVRTLQAEGKVVPAWQLKAGAVLNVLAVNLDKAAQLAKMAKPAPVPPPPEPAPTVPVEEVVAQIEEAATQEPTPELKPKKRTSPKPKQSKKPVTKKKKH